MNQETLDWLLAQQPVTSSNASNSPATNEITVSDDLFADIPTTAQLQQQQQQAANTPANEITVKDDLFADIPVTPQAIEQKPSLWGQVKKGAAGVAQNYYANKALEAAEEYQRLKLAEGKGLLGASKPSLSGVQNFMGVSAENKEEELQKRKAEIAEYRKKAQEYQTYAENVPVPEAVRNFLDKRRDAHTTWWEDFKEAPFEISANVAAESLAASGVTILAGVGGALVGGLPGAMGAQGMVSGRMEYVNRINEGLQQAGIDINDVDQFIAAVNNDEIMDPIREDALKYSIAIGTMDAASAFLGGKVLAPKSLFARSAAKGQAVNVPVQAVTQAGFGGGGEALGQLWTEGKITDQRAIAAEVAGDFVFAPVEATATLYAVTKGSKGIKEDQLKATNELIDVLNRKRQKAYNSRDPQAIEKANKDFNEFLNIRQNLEKQLDMTDTESLLQAEAVLQTALNTKVFQYHKAKRDFADKSIIESLEKDVRELTNRHQVVFDTIHSQGRTIQAPELMKQQEALDLVKADREFRKEQLQAEEEELFRRKTNPLAAAEEEAKRIAEGGGDSLDQQMGASYAYGKARSESEMADEMAEMESALNYAEVEPLLREQLEAIKTYQTSTGLKKIVAEKKIKKLRAQIAAIKAQRPKSVPLEEQPPGTTPNVEQSTEELAPTEPEPYQPKSLYQIVREGKERRAREGDWEAAEAQAQAQQAEQTQQEIAAWEASQGITEQEAIQQRRQENLHNELRKAWQQVHQQSVNEAHGIIDEAMELGLIDDEASTRQLADNGEIPPDLTQRIANEKRLLAREKAENDREAFVEKQQHRQKVARLEQHIADQQKARDYELALQQRDENLADITEGEIEDWEDLLGITQETAIDEAAQARQARQPAPEPVAEPTAEALLAERVRYAHQVVNAAITNGSIGLLGEPIARKYADRGEIPPSLMSEADQLADQISRLEQHIQSDQARAGWTAEQPAPGAMQEKGTTEYQPIAAPKPESPATPENVFTEPRNISTLDLEKTFQDRFLKFIDEYKNNVQTTPANERTPEQNLIADITSAEVMTPDVAEPLLRRAKALEREDVVDFILIRLQRSTNNTQTTVGVSENNPRYNEIKEKLENRKKELEEKTAKILKEYSKNNMENGTPTTEQPKQTEQTPKNTAPVTNMREFWQRVKSDFIPNYWLNDFGKPTDKIKDFSADQDYYISFDGVTGKEVGKVEKTQGNIINIVYPNGKKMGVMEYENPKIVTVEQFEQFGRKQKLQDIQMQREKERQEERIAAQEKKRQDEIAQEAKNAELIEQYTRHQGINLNRTGISKMTAYDEHGGMSELKIGNDLIYMEPKGHTDSLWTTIIKIQANDPNRPKTVFSREYATFGEAKENMLNDYKEAIIEEMERAPQNYKIDGDAQFEAQLKQIGKEWIKDQQHRFYFSDIIQELAGTNQPIPANAKLWYDKRTGWYDSQNLDDAVYDAAVERLELLRQSIIEEHGKQALEPETPASPETTNTIKQDVEALIKQFPEWWMNEAHTYAIAQGLIDLGLVENEDVLRILWDDSHEVAQFIEPILDGYESNTEEANSIKTLNNDQEESTQSLEDLKALHQDLIEQRNQAEYKDIQAGRTPTGNARLDDRIRQIEDVIKQMEQEQTAQEPTNTTEETETFDPKEFSNVEGNLADLTVENLKAIGESQRYGLKSIAQRLGRSVTDPEQLYDIIQEHIALLDKIPFHIKKKLRAQLEKDQWENTIPFRELSDEVLADLRKVLPVKYFDINQKRLDLSYIAREIQLEAEGKIHKEDRTPRGFTQESGSHTFNKEDGSTETFEYNRIANLDKVSGSPDVVAPFFVELKEGDLLVDKSKRKMGVVSHTKGGKIHFKGEREPWPINVEVHKDDRRKLGDEIRRLKAKQKGKPEPKTTTGSTKETIKSTPKQSDMEKYKPGYDRMAEKLRENANKEQGTYNGKSLVAVAKDIAEHAIQYNRRLENNEITDIAKKHDIPENLVRELATGTYSYNRVLFESQKFNNKDASDFLMYGRYKAEEKTKPQNKRNKPIADAKLTNQSIKSLNELIKHKAFNGIKNISLLNENNNINDAAEYLLNNGFIEITSDPELSTAKTYMENNRSSLWKSAEGLKVERVFYKDDLYVGQFESEKYVTVFYSVRKPDTATISSTVAPTTPTSTTEETSQGQLQENDFKQDPYDIYKYKTPDPDIELSENRKDGTYSVLVKGRVAGTGIRNRVLAYQRGMEDKEKRGKAEEQRKNDTRNQPLSAAKFNTPLEFGKYKGKTINEIGTEDRGYLRWLADTKLKLNALISDHAGEWLDTNGLWSTEELNEAATLARENILTNENILSGKETSAEVTRKMGKKDQVITITPYPNHLQINTTTYTTKYGNRSRQTGEQTRRNEYNYKSLSEVMTEQEIDQLKKLEAGTVAIPPPTSETIPDENTGRTGQGTLEGVSTGTIQGATRGGDTGPRSPDHTGESSRTDSTSDGYNELRGSETDSLLGTDFHPPGGISNTSHDGDRRGGIDSPSADFIITETQDYDREKFSIAERFQGNIDAIKLLKSLGTRPATPEQKKILAGYVGWGGMKNVFDADGQVAKGWEKRHAELKALLTEDEYNAAMQSTQNAHYTSWPVINAIYKGLEAIGFTGGRLLETSVGVGNFFGMMPTAMRQRSRLIGVELDHITGGIADKLYGNSARIHQPRDFADFDFAEATYDVVTGNPPFGAETITDLKHKDISGMRIHNYFLLKGMKALRPGGVLAVVVSKGFMDSSANQKGREMMFREARLLGAWRLPNEAFGGQANTDVTTDVIFLQKRENPLIESEARDVNRNPFTNTADFTGADGNTMAINEYFVANPEHLLGDMVMTVGNSRYSAEPEPTLNARKGLNWKKTLLKGTNKLEANYNPEENIESSAVIGNPEASTDIEKAEVNGLYITDTGELYRRFTDREGETQGAPVTTYVNAQGTEITLRPNQINILKAAVRLARIARDLINLQITDITDPELEPLRQQLNREYDQFIKKNKMINRPYNKSLLINADLTIAPLLMALENNYRKEVKNDKKKLVQTEQSTKADIFTKRTQEPYKPISKVETADQALLVTLGQLGKVDLERMTELSGIGQEKLIEQLQGQIFEDPVEGWVTRDEYLSGNVKLKLRQAEEAGLTDYAKVLKEALPDDVPATDIVTVFGAHWQTPEVINAFWEHLGGTRAKTTYVPERSDWIFTGNPSDKKKWRTSEFNMLDMFERTLNNRTLAVTYKDDVTGKPRLDVRATDAALAKADEIRNEFVGWLWRDEQRREAMVRRYNDLVNTHKNRQYDGSFLSLPGMNKNIKLYDTQKNAVWRSLQSKTTLLDHIVGAGKTFTMIASAMEMKRTGMAKKPMFVVPNHLIGQWAEDFARLYPNAKVLAATSKDLGKHKRREFLARIATGNWDAVIVAHSSFGKIPTDPATEQWFLQQQIKDADKAIRAMKAAEGKDQRTVAQAAKARDRLKNKLKENLANTDKDQGLTWNEMGIDALFVDEAHEFKNLSFMTSMNRVKNVNPEGSDMAMDLFIKTQALLRNTGGRNLVFATGTPVSNSMAELFTMQRYLDYDGLTQSKTNYFDAWAKTFGRTVSKMERKASGKYDRESRFAEFINLPELIAKYRTFADTINQEDIDAARAKNGEGKIVPKVKGGKPQVKIAPRSMFQEAYMGEIENRFANMPADPREDNPLWATNDARKAALDMRLIYDDLPDDPNSKINLAVDEMIRVYHQWQEDKGTQLVFCDLSTPKKSQAAEIKAFKEKIQKLAKKDKEQQHNIDKMTVMEAYDYLQSMAEREIGNAVDILDKFSLDEVSSWTSIFDVYNDVKQKLIAQGVPANEIAYIHDAKTQPQKDELFDKVKRGDIRFLLGSTAKMGAGTNVQNKLVALHHLDAPWRPSDLEQREGRIIRQGNEFFKRDPEGFEVEILRYATEQTYDTNMWQTLEVKALFIQQLRKGNLTDRTASDIAGEAATAAEMKAASSGDPRIIEMVDLTAELRRLDNLRTTHQSNRTQASIDAGKLTKEQQYLPKLISRLKEDLNNTLPIPVKGPALKTPEGDGFQKAKEANEWFKRQVLKGFKNPNSPLWDGAVIASYRGFDVYVEISTQGKGKYEKQYVEIELVGEQNHRGLSYHRIDEVAWNGLSARFNNAIEDIPGNINNAEQRLASLPPLIEENETLARTPWPHEEDYQDKQERNRELLEELSTEEVENPAAKWQPEYELFRQMATDFSEQKRKATESAKILEFSARQNRANRLMEMILYSKPSQEKAQAKKAMALAKEQQFEITDQAMKEARQRADEALAKHKLAEEQKKQQEKAKTETSATGQAATTGTTTEEITFTSADEAIKHAQETKQAITADNGNIRLERSSLGNWQLSVAWRPDQKMDSDSIAMDTDLALMTGGRGFTAVGDKMVMNFKEDRLPVVIRRLYNKMPLQGVKAQKAQAEPIGAMYSKVARGEVVKGIPLKQGQRIAEKIGQKLNLGRSERLTVDIMKSPEDLIQEFNDRGIELTDDDKKDIRESKALFVPRVDRATGKVGLWRVVGFTDMAQSAQDFRASLRHEIIGHFGMDTLHPEDKAAIFEKIENSRKNKHIRPLYDAALKSYGKYGKDVVLDEIIAGLAEAKTGYPRMLWTRIKALVIRGLRRTELMSKHEISKTELQDLVRVLRARVKNAETPLFTSSIIPESMVVNESPPDIGRIRYRQSDNSADISSPNNSNNPADNANRLFSTLALAENELIKNALKVTGRKASSGMAHFRKLMLPTMGLRQIVDTYESVFKPMAADIDTATNTSKGNPIQNYQRYVQGMQSLKANKLADADNVDKQWGELSKANPTEYNALANMMHEATVYEVFPEKEYFIEHENMRELRRDYAREQDPAKQAELRKRIMFERERLTVYNKLSEQYQQMSQQAKDVYQAVEGFHEDMWNDHQQALEDKITRSMNSNEAQAFIQQLKAQFHEAKVRGPYFPLQRFGSFYLIAEDQQGVYYREHYETEAQLYKHKEEIEKAGMSVLSFGLMPDFTSRKLEGVSGFADQIHLALESDKFANVSAAIKDEIRTEINQLALQMLPDVSAAKSMIRRRKVKGYSENARRAFAFSAIHQSNRLARTVYGDQMTAELERIHDDIDSHNENPLMDMAHRTIAAQVLSELEKQHETIMNPKGSPIAARITNMAFIWYMGASAGAGFINMSQTLLIGIPLMGGRFGYRKTTAAVAIAAKDFGLHGYNKLSLRESMFTLSKATKGVTDNEKRMLQQLIDDGTIDTTQTSTLSQIADQDLRAEAQVNQDRWVKINRLLGYFFHNAEVANREVTALATYRMAIDEGKTHENAVEIARKLTFDSHFDYSGANRPRIIKNDWMKVFTIFKQYSQNMTYTLVRNFVKSRPFSKFSPAEKKQARKALAGILFAHATAAGTLGLPLVSIIGPVLAEAFGDDDDEFRDWKTMYRNWLADLVGKDMGHAIAKGVFNGFMGTDIHARVKIDDLWIQEPNWEMSAREESMHYLLQGLGPASSAVINMFWLGPEQIAEGNTWKGIEKMVPKFIRDGMRTIRYANEGATVGRDGYQAIIEEFTPGELARQFLGVSPARLSEGYEARSAVKNLEQKISGRRGELMQGYTRAYMDGDYEKANKILTEIQQFNISNPLYGINGDALRQSLRMKYRYKELSQSGIYLPEAKMGLLNEARFAL